MTTRRRTTKSASEEAKAAKVEARAEHVVEAVADGAEAPITDADVQAADEAEREAVEAQVVDQAVREAETHRDEDAKAVQDVKTAAGSDATDAEQGKDDAGTVRARVVAFRYGHKSGRIVVPAARGDVISVTPEALARGEALGVLARA